MILYSVIIPVYNAEKTLRRCVDSLLNQNCSDAEIILVNDGSTDGSKALCQQYADSNACVRLIDQPNGGVSSARNAGLDAAQGEYVLFFFFYDYVASDYFYQINKCIHENKWDLIQFSRAVDNGKDIRAKALTNGRFYSRTESFPQLIDDLCRKILNPPTAKVYRRDMLRLNAIEFPVGVSIAEDRAFNIRYSMHVNQYVRSDRVIYYISIENTDSLSRGSRSDIAQQLDITSAYNEESLRITDIPETEKELYREAISFGICRGVYRDAKQYRKKGMGWVARQRALWHNCSTINHLHMKYPKTKYCQLITLPVRLYQTWVIDYVAKRLLKE